MTIDFSLSPAQKKIQLMARDFSENALAPLVRGAGGLGLGQLLTEHRLDRVPAQYRNRPEHSGRASPGRCSASRFFWEVFVTENPAH